MSGSEWAKKAGKIAEREFAWEYIAEQYLQIYQRILTQPGKKAGADVARPSEL
jgi:hypothetical protein